MGLGCRSLGRLFLLSGLGLPGAVFKTIAVVASFNNVAAMREPVQQCRGHLGIAEDAGPFGEAQIGGNDQAYPFV